MNRRTFLGGVSTAAVVGIAGCLGGADERPDRTDDEHLEELRAEIGDRGVDVLAIELDADVVSVEHDSEDPNDAVANVAMAFVERVAEGWEVDRLEGTLRVRDGFQGFVMGSDASAWTWHAEAAWARAYADGDIGPDEYGERINKTFEAVEDDDGE